MVLLRNFVIFGIFELVVFGRKNFVNKNKL